jgi:hypothetical protein
MLGSDPIGAVSLFIDKLCNLLDIMEAEGQLGEDTLSGRVSAPYGPICPRTSRGRAHGWLPKGSLKLNLSRCVGCHAC